MTLPNDMPIPFPIVAKFVPNYAVGRAGRIPDTIVIHIAEGMRDSVYQQFLNHPFSTHFLVNQDGSIWQFVNTSNTAWGNGIVDNPTSETVLDRLPTNPNIYTISIEHEGFSKADINDVQYQASSSLVKFLSQKWGILLDATHVIPHHQIEYKKSCPGMIDVSRILMLARAV